MRYIWIICLLALCSCNPAKDEPIVDEDYGKLFPPKEIEKPENKRGEHHVQLCDPSQALETYKYPGTETPDDADEYKITITCSFQEKGADNYFVEDIESVYQVKYINEKKELVEINCGQEDNSPGKPNTMYNNRPLNISFTVRSGYPLYLSVSGEGPRNSNVKASIKAISSDGLIEIPTLETAQYQNQEGIIGLQYPYCEYIVLP